jgi:elongation factor Tu
MPVQASYIMVATLGPDGAGKTTLARALAAVLGPRGHASAPRAVVQDGLGAEVFEFHSATGRLYQLVDFADQAAEHALTASVPFHCGVLVVSVIDGVLPATVRSVAHARETGLRGLVVALARCELVDDPELLDLVEVEIRDLLSKYEFRGDDAPFVRCAAQAALHGDPRAGHGLDALVAALDRVVGPTG